ncbi:hypothetical protein H0X06_02295 [Candidatus Dependentiae bacterium]|nr:hypothetical protein [Candidatus Dependentiae bacterium]
MKQKIAILCIWWVSFVHSSSTPYLISFFIKPLLIPTMQSGTQSSALAEKQLALRMLSSSDLHAGIFVSYAGISTNSDREGQILLPRKTAQPELHVFITEKIVLLPLSPQKKKTIVGFKSKPETLIQHFTFVRQKDPETEAYVWQGTQSEWPSNKKMPYDAIIIFADPESIISPVGASVTQLSENFILPDFYITDTKKTPIDALRFLTLKSYVKPLTFEYSFHPQDIQKLMKT